jgi:hypothetical protein
MKAHQWYRVEMTATGQMYVRVVLWGFVWSHCDPVRGGAVLSRENLGKFTCSCWEGHPA